MLLRLALLTPFALAAAALTSPDLTAQDPAPPKAQEPTPAERIEQLEREKAQLEREIEYAKQRAAQARALLAETLGRGKPDFRVIDAGKPANQMPVASTRPERRFARVGSAEEMNLGGNAQMVMVNGRGISESNFAAVVDYLSGSGLPGTEDLFAQRALFDLIRIEGIASQFEENEGEVKLAETLGKLQSGELSVAAAAAEFGTVPGADDAGAVVITHNSIHGPSFERVAFATPEGQLSQPFRTTRGYAVLKVDGRESGDDPRNDKVNCHVVEFAYTPDQAKLQKAQFAVNAGQLDVLVRDDDVMARLPAMFKKPAPRPSTRQQLEQQITRIEAELKRLKAGDAPDTKATAALERQLENLKLRLEQLKETPNDADAGGAPDMLRPVRKDAQGGGKLDVQKAKTEKGGTTGKGGE